MKAQLFGIALAALVGLAFTGTETACSSSSSGSSGGGGGGISCALSDGSECITYPAGSVTTCPTGMSVSSCATSMSLGCCSQTVMGSNGQSYTFDTCYYCKGALSMGGSASTFQTACTGSSMGKWTAGDTMSCGGGGDGGGSSSGGSSGSSSGSGGDASSD